ncbi:hypothetical protein KGF57_004978 [Candida theae]|uniref:WH1 domain-containing protein n=1 Tax=Candida theae TaxID=1198502 RepID=A0AAD5FWK9_9ASCO|nr:uncharacterized protein KGF57_004978 [Candida theae]KAI5949016.1 hypothetical protein KGF57_004978 [Candida theae]
MGILTTQDKEKIKRTIPKASNKIIDATVARLYIAYPDPTKWVYTGLVGAIALVDDLVGHTFFLKLVDITGHRGVVWDQELYVDFEYNQDRKFFHTFEIEDCLVGLLFEDTNDASHFYKRVTHRQKHGSSATVKNKNAIALKERVEPKGQNAPGPRGEFMDVNTAQRQRRAKGVLYYDDVPPPEWKSLYAELESAGITEDMIVDNRQFIKDYIAQQGGPLVGLEPPIPRKYQRAHERATGIDKGEDVASIPESKSSMKHKKAPPPPPLAHQTSSPYEVPSSNQSVNSPTPETESLSPAPTHTSELTPDPAAELAKRASRLPPAAAFAPPSRTTTTASNERPLPTPPSQQQQLQPQHQPSPPSQYPTQQDTQRKHAVPPPLANTVHKAPPPFQFNQAQQAPQNGPPPPARGGVPPPPPARANAPPPPPRANHPVQGNVPAPPPRASPIAQTQTGSHLPPPAPPPRSSRGAAPPPPPPRSSAAHPSSSPQVPPRTAFPPPPAQQQQQQQQQPNTAAPPALQPRPMAAPPSQQPQTQPYGQSTVPPPPPPLPPTMSHAPDKSTPAPPAPPPPNMSSGSFAESTGDAGRDALLSSIRGAGIGSLKKTDKSQLEKPSVILQEARGEPVQSNDTSGAAGGGGNAPGAPPASLADALSQALNKRKGKVAHSDDEDDDDW